MRIHLKDLAKYSQRILGAAFVAVLVTGCKTNAAVGMQMVLPPMAQVIDVPKDKVFLMASPVSQPLPDFPSGVPRGTNASVCVELVIDEDGAVASATPLYGLPECPTLQEELDSRLVGSAVGAAEQWQFLAAAICTFSPDVPMTDDCSGDGVVISPVAIKIAYVFTFQSGGRVSAKARRA